MNCVFLYVFGHEKEFNLHIYDHRYEKTFYDEFGIVGSAQAWNTVASRRLNLELGELTGETCDIKVFTTSIMF